METNPSSDHSTRIASAHLEGLIFSAANRTSSSLTERERLASFFFLAGSFAPTWELGYHSTCHRNSLLNFAKVRLAESAYKRVHAQPPNFLVNYEQERRRWQRQQEKVLVEEFKTLSPFCPLCLPLWKEELAVTHPADG